MDLVRDEDTFGERPTLGRPLPEKEPEGAARTWTDEDAERETFRRPSNLEAEMMLANRYRVLRRLGEGGMGSVWLVEDLKLDNRKFAVKMLPAVLAGKKGSYRQVKQEALMAMKLAHPNIATVRAFEEDAGNPFLVMDYIEGNGLDDILEEKGKLSEAETLRLLGPVASALDYAHSQGVVHRDVKPGNVMVDKNGRPFVLDFGIAREIQETMTRVTGKFSSGTLLYMSPEQLRGRAPKAAQDVYSFAALAYECLAGHPPFYRGGVEDQIKNEPPEALEEGLALAGLRKGIMAGLAKEPEGRPGTCAGVLGDGVVATQKEHCRQEAVTQRQWGESLFPIPMGPFSNPSLSERENIESNFVLVSLFRRKFDFEGRSSRREFWQAFAHWMAVTLLSLGLGTLIYVSRHGDVGHCLEGALPGFFIPWGFYTALTLVPGLAVLCRRFHDAGVSGKMGWLFLTGVFALWLIPCLCRPSQPEPNAWGKVPEIRPG